MARAIHVLAAAAITTRAVTGWTRRKVVAFPTNFLRLTRCRPVTWTVLIFSTFAVGTATFCWTWGSRQLLTARTSRLTWTRRDRVCSIFILARTTCDAVPSISWIKVGAWFTRWWRRRRRRRAIVAVCTVCTPTAVTGLVLHFCSATPKSTQNISSQHCYCTLVNIYK